MGSQEKLMTIEVVIMYFYQKGSEKDFIGAPDWANSRVLVEFDANNGYNSTGEYWSESANPFPKSDDVYKHQDVKTKQMFDHDNTYGGESVFCIAIREKQEPIVENSFNVGDTVVISQSYQFESGAEVDAGDTVEILRKKVDDNDPNKVHYVVYSEELNEATVVSVVHGRGGIQFLRPADETKYPVKEITTFMYNSSKGLSEDEAKSLTQLLICKGYIKDNQ